MKRVSFQELPVNEKPISMYADMLTDDEEPSSDDGGVRAMSISPAPASVPEYRDFSNCEKTLNNKVFVLGIPKRYQGGILYLDGNERQTTSTLLSTGFQPTQCIAPDFNETTVQNHLSKGINSYHGTFFECLIQMGPELIQKIAHVYMDIMSTLHGSASKLTRTGAEGKKISISCYPLRNIMHYLRYAPDQVHFAVTLCSSRRPVKEWKKGIMYQHYFKIYEQTLLDMFVACGFEVVKGSKHNRHYKRTSVGSHPMTFFDFYLTRVRAFDLDLFEEAIPLIYSEKHCMRKISMNRWFTTYKRAFPQLYNL